MEALAQVFKALSDPIRLRILNLLLQQDSFCVCELVNILDINQSTVSRHLSYLKNSGLVDSWREGVWIHYALKKEAIGFLNLPQFEAQLQSQTQIQQDLQHYQSNTLKSCAV